MATTKAALKTTAVTKAAAVEAGPDTIEVIDGGGNIVNVAPPWAPYRTKTVRGFVADAPMRIAAAPGGSPLTVAAGDTVLQDEDGRVFQSDALVPA